MPRLTHTKAANGVKPVAAFSIFHKGEANKMAKKHRRRRKKTLLARGARRTRQLEQLEPRYVLDSTVVFNEIMFHPADNEALEFIELHNQMAVDMDVSKWELSGGVNFEFPEGTVAA